MVPLSGDWRKIVSRIKGRPIVLFLDYDGTLVPIRKRPGSAVMSRRQRHLLRRLTTLPGVQVALVSGRALPKLKRFVGLRNIVYVGNHGLEMEGPDFQWTHPRAESLLDRHGLRKRILGAFDDLPGILVEDKRLSLSVHYRLATLTAQRGAWKRLRPMLEKYLGRTVVLRNGKKVWEVRPALPFTKGTAVETLMKRRYRARRAIPIYIGDDNTDEDALEAIAGRGIGIKVLSRENRTERSHARYYVRSTSAVHRFLSRLYSVRRNESASA